MPMAQFYIGGEKYNHGTAYADAALRALELRQRQEQYYQSQSTERERIALERERLRATLLDAAKAREDQRRFELEKLDRLENREDIRDTKQHGRAKEILEIQQKGSMDLEKMRLLAQKELHHETLTAEDQRLKAKINSDEKLAAAHNEIVKEEAAKDRAQRSEFHADTMGVDRERLGVERDRLGMEDKRLLLDRDRLDNEMKFQNAQMDLKAKEVEQRKRDYARELRDRLVLKSGEIIKDMVSSGTSEPNARLQVQEMIRQAEAEMEGRKPDPQMEKKVPTPAQVLNSKPEGNRSADLAQRWYDLARLQAPMGLRQMAGLGRIFLDTIQPGQPETLTIADAPGVIQKARDLQYTEDEIDEMRTEFVRGWAPDEFENWLMKRYRQKTAK